jgi:hypothetical protein
VRHIKRALAAAFLGLIGPVFADDALSDQDITTMVKR